LTGRRRLAINIDVDKLCGGGKDGGPRSSWPLWVCWYFEIYSVKVSENAQNLV
jgi:hypothetical protein